MKLKERHSSIEFPIFAGYTVTVIVTSDVAASRTKRDGIFGEHYDGMRALAMHCHSLLPVHNGRAWLFFTSDAGVGTVAHECWHCIRRMLHWAGADCENEVVAYHLAYLVEKVWKFLRK